MAEIRIDFSKQMNNGIFFDPAYLETLRSQFSYVDSDPVYGKRMFFDNSGGALRLKRCVEAKARLELYPDCPERTHECAQELKKIVLDGTRDIMEIMFGAKSGAIITELTASQTMFHMVELIMENVPGTNAVVSVLEHPSAFDAVDYFCRKTGKELRVISADPATGGIDPDAAADLVDENTCLLSVMAASNLTGVNMDLAAIVRKARAKKPGLHIISDAVQYAPHCAMNAEALELDGMNFAPYKFFGVRGCGFAWVSERVARLPHRKLILKDPEVFELGTSAPGNFLAAEEIIDYAAEIGQHYIGKASRREMYLEGMKRIHLHERALLHRMLEGTEEIPGLRHIPGVEVYCDAGELTTRDLIAAIGFAGKVPAECVEEYKKRGIIVCDRLNTSMYAKRIVEALGLTGAIRVSPLHCHGIEDIDAFLRVTAEMAKDFAQ